jgi:hypothetical protein
MGETNRGAGRDLHRRRNRRGAVLMQNIKFVQSVTISVTFDMSFPSDWTLQQILESIKDTTTDISAHVLPETLPQGAVSNSTIVDDIIINHTAIQENN